MKLLKISEKEKIRLSPMDIKPIKHFVKLPKELNVECTKSECPICKAIKERTR